MISENATLALTLFKPMKDYEVARDYLTSSAKKIRLDNLSKAYTNVVAIEPLSLDIPAGGLISILGPSGCGKSTTLRIIAGLEEPDSGRVFLDDRDITDLPANRRGLGLVFQNYALFPHMTVEENVSYGLRVSGVSRLDTERRTREALALVQLIGVDKRYPAMLSGGQQQRVALARTLVMQPHALLLDEPLGALDKNLRSNMQFELRKLQRTLGITTILVTHDQEEALTLSDLVVVMNAGRIVQIGTPNDIYDKPQSRFVAEFLGSANIFKCFVSGNGKEYRLATDGEQVIGTISSGLIPSQGEILVAVRPECVTLSANEMQSTDVVLKGTVLSHIFRGDNHVYEVRVPGLEMPVYAQAQHSRLEYFAQVNDPVYLSWYFGNVVVLNDRI